MTTIASFKMSLEGNQPPENISVFLQALWYERTGNWEKAHSLIDHLSGTTAAAVHAYLHRVEGDNQNATYWYAKAGKKIPGISLPEEWQQLAEQLLQAEK